MKFIKKFLIILICLITIFTFFINSNDVQATYSGQLDTYDQVITDMRAVWVSTVYNIDIEPQTGTTEKDINDWKENYLKILDDAVANNLNTIVFQVRPANDAFYPSKYNPWSKYLAGYGVDPGWDPLAWMIEVTHERGLDYHAWLNPYRASTEKPTTIVESNKIKDVDIDNLNSIKDEVFGAMKEKSPNVDNPALTTGDKLYYNVVMGTEDLFVLNPASSDVINHIVNTINEIIENYDIDGIHFDDYFYPSTKSYGGTNSAYKGYTYSCEPWVDLKDYKAYVENVGDDALSIYDWRRENVNTLIKSISDLIRTKNENKKVKCAFGISPAARWAPTVEACSSAKERGAEGGMSGSCYNYYSYSDLYADTYGWAIKEWVDYICPQNYTNLKGDYDEIVKWWSNALQGSKTKLYMGTALYQCSTTWGRGITEIYDQIRYNSQFINNVSGYFLFSYRNLERTNDKVKPSMSAIVNYAWKYKTLTPLYGYYTYEKEVTSITTPKKLTVNDSDVSVVVNKNEGAKAYAIYAVDEAETVTLDSFTIDRLKALELSENDALEFKKEEGKKYFLVTYDQDNTLYPEFYELQLDNELPTVSIKTNKTAYGYDETIDIDVEITDPDSEEFVISISYASNGSTYNKKIVENEIITDHFYQTTMNTGNISTQNGTFKVEVKDVMGTVYATTSVVIMSAAPTVSIKNVEDIEYETLREIEINVDDDTDNLIEIKVYKAMENGEYILWIEENIKKGQLVLNYIADEIGDFTIKVVVKDSDLQVAEAISNKFKVYEVKEEPIEPTTPFEPAQKEGCNCKKNLGLALSSIVILLGMIVIIRKEL